jgi:hypothetical protein
MILMASSFMFILIKTVMPQPEVVFTEINQLKSDFDFLFKDSLESIF